MTEADDLQLQVAWGCRILAMWNHVDLTLGHLSGRGADGKVYIKGKDLALQEVTPEDVLTIDVDGTKLSGHGAMHLETVLHTEIYKVRPDVGAVVHSHPPYATALGAAEAELRLLTHDAVLFHDGLAHFEETAELITERSQGKSVAKALDNRRALLMRNHGVIVVGKDIPWAVIAALTLERAIQFQVTASSLGKLRPMSAEMARTLYPTKYRDGFIYKYWQYLVRECRRQGMAAGLPDQD